MQFDRLVISCEHASNRVPARYATVMARARRVLDTHRGHDIGAADVARRLARRFGVTASLGEVTRLLIDLNRSLHHRAVFSEFSRGLSDADRDRVIARYYTPYRDAVETAVREPLARGRSVLHVSVHSFTPRLDGHTRTADVGLLYDPARAAERTTCAAWKRAIAAADPTLRVRRNYPYLGTADGLPPALRKRLGRRRFACIEVELNQALLASAAGRARATAVLSTVIAASLGR